MLRAITISILNVCFLCSCHVYRSHVEYSDLNVQTSAGPADHPRKLRLKGIIVGGVLVPKQFESHFEGQTLLIELVATFAMRGYTNAFNVTFDIPDSVAAARFGRKRELIWSRAPQTSNQTPQPTAGRSDVKLSVSLTRTLQFTLALASGG
jgi:hypothetical protein